MSPGSDTEAAEPAVSGRHADDVDRPAGQFGFATAHGQHVLPLADFCVESRITVGGRSSVSTADGRSASWPRPR